MDIFYEEEIWDLNQVHGLAERKNLNIVEAAKAMLHD